MCMKKVRNMAKNLRGKKGGSSTSTTVNGWFAGPVIGRTNYSKLITLEPQGGLVGFDIPDRGEIDALVRKVSRLSAVLSITFRLTGHVTPAEFPDKQPLIGLMIQRRGDTWSGRGQYEFYRFYSPQTVVAVPGEHTLAVPLTGWTGVFGKPNESMLVAALANLDNMAITFGHSGGRSHGVRGPARFELLSVSL